MISQTSRFSEVNRLRQALEKLDPGGSGLLSLSGRRVMDRGFFPGGNGLLEGEDALAFPNGGTVVLGTNFGAIGSFCKPDGSLICADETNNPGVWRGLRRLFALEELKRCFFTNAWPFLHIGDGNNVPDDVKRSWLKDVRLMNSCVDFFYEELDVVRPSRVVALGPAAGAFLAAAFPKVLGVWKENSMRAMDIMPFASVKTLVGDIRFVAVVHPAYSHINAKKRIDSNRDEVSLLARARS